MHELLGRLHCISNQLHIEFEKVSDEVDNTPTIKLCKKYNRLLGKICMIEEIIQLIEEEYDRN